MSQTMDTFETMREQLCNNLKLLSIEEFLRRRREVLPINPDTFRKFTPKAFQLITYHLFNKLNAEECGKRFIGCFPVKDRKQEGEFRQITNQWLKEITTKETNHHFPRVVAIYFQHFTPESVFCHLYLEFTNYLLIKEIQKTSSGAQHLIPINDSTKREETTEKLFTEYEITMSDIKEETQELAENMRYFVESFCKIRNSMNDLLRKKETLFEGIRKSYDLDSDADVDQFLDNHYKSLSESVFNLKDNLLEMNQLVAKNRNSYLVAFEPQINPSNDLTIDLNQWFGRNKLYSFSDSAQEFIRRVKHCDSVLQNVSENCFQNLSNISTKYSTELENYRKHLKEMTSEMNSMLDQLKQLAKTKRAELLANPEIIERRKWFAERIPDISKLNFKFEPKPGIIKPKEQSDPEDVQPLRASVDSNEFDLSPAFTPGRPSMVDFSFQVMDISTCHYVAPTGCPLSMNDSHLFSPVENKNKSVFD